TFLPCQRGQTLNSLVTAFSTISRPKFADRFTGFQRPGIIQICAADLEEFPHIRAEIALCKICMQPLYSGHHFILSYKHSNANHVVICNNLNSGLSIHFQSQLFMLYSRNDELVNVRIAVVNMQEPGSNNCGPMVCAYMAEYLVGGNPESVLFVRSQEQRDWLRDVIHSGEFKVRPCRRGRKGKRDFTSPTKIDNVITSADAKKIRSTLNLEHRPRDGF